MFSQDAVVICMFSHIEVAAWKSNSARNRWQTFTSKSLTCRCPQIIQNREANKIERSS